jgi:hypothetical protein
VLFVVYTEYENATFICVPMHQGNR